MKRKKIMTAAAILITAGLLGACGKEANESMVQTQMQSGDGSQEGASIVNEMQSDKDSQQNISAANEEEGKQTDFTENELTGQTARQEMDMDDYSIESYEAIQQFGHELLAQNIHDKNPVLSPVSAYLALAMAGCGADGTTREEFYRVLGAEGEDDMLIMSYDMISTLPAKGDVLNLSIADSAWIDDEFIVNEAWINTIRTLIDAEAFHTDLSTEGTMDQINHWIDDKTNGLIDKMLTEPLDQQTKLALFNTVYFKGKWVIPFDANDTRKEDFYLSRRPDDKVKADMMNLYGTELDYIANDIAEGVILPYQQNDGGSSQNLSFVALKPTNKGDVREVYNILTSEVISEILADKQACPVNLKLPKFEITFDKQLNNALSNMGLVECFDVDRADFDQMGKAQNGENLYIGLVRQKAKIIVDEEGTEAAAVTEVLMACGAIMEEDPEKPREVYFDEPFIYMIMDIDKEIPLFVGILDNPVS